MSPIIKLAGSFSSSSFFPSPDVFVRHDRVHQLRAAFQSRVRSLGSECPLSRPAAVYTDNFMKG